MIFILIKSFQNFSILETNPWIERCFSVPFTSSPFITCGSLTQPSSSVLVSSSHDTVIFINLRNTLRHFNSNNNTKHVNQHL